MAAGVRLLHRKLRGVMLVLPHPTQRYKVPYLCPACGVTHERKTYHLRLDGEGAVIVSKEVFERLREMGLPDLQVMNEVQKPPSQTIQVNAPSHQPKQYEEVRVGRLTLIKNKLVRPRSRGKYQVG